MPFHIRVRPTGERVRPHEMVYAVNLDEETLHSRFLVPYEHGQALTGGGRSISSSDIDQVLVLETAEPVAEAGSTGWGHAEANGINRTDDFITGPPGGESVAREPDRLAPGVQRNPKRVMIVHGRNIRALDALRAFLQSLGLEPILWEDAIAETGEGSPHNLAAVIAAMSVAQAVVVLFTAEDEARLLEEFRGGDSTEEEFVGQPRPNVLVEAGLAIGLGRERAILTRLGPIRSASDLDGLNAVNLANGTGPRTALRRRLVSAGCDVNERTDYLEPGVAGDFDSARAR